MKTCVLLSTYNGERYLKEQLLSLENQTILIDVLIVRDDGSSDTTIEILQWFKGVSRIDVRIIQGSNLGPAQSFMELMKLGVEVDGDAYFFCDQDDLWLRDKIENFIRALSNSETPHLVISKLILVDKDNIQIGVSNAPRRMGFGNTILENVATGCASGFNRSCLEVAVSRNVAGLPMHDRWIYMVASLFGHTTYMDTPTIRYRQHEQNVVGAAHSLFSSAIRRVYRFIKFRRVNRTQIAEIALDAFGDIMPEYHKETCEIVVRSRHSMSYRLLLIMSSRCWRQSFGDEFLWRALILFSRI